MRGEPAPRGIGEDLARPVAVGGHRNAVVGGGPGELREEQLVLAVGLVRRRGQQHLQSVRERVAVAEAAFPRPVTRAAAGNVQIVDVAPALGDDVDDSEERARDVQGGVGSANHLHAVDQVDIDRELRAKETSVEDVVVDSMSVDHQRDSTVVVSRRAIAPESEVAVVSVVADIAAAHVPEDVRQGAIAESLDVLGRDDDDGGRRLRDPLLEARGAIDRVEVDQHQLVEAHVQHIGGGGLLVRRRVRRPRDAQQQEQDDGKSTAQRPARIESWVHHSPSRFPRATSRSSPRAVGGVIGHGGPGWEDNRPLVNTNKYNAPRNTQDREPSTTRFEVRPQPPRSVDSGRGGPARGNGAAWPRLAPRGAGRPRRGDPVSTPQELRNDRVILEPASEANVDLLISRTLDPAAQGPYTRVPQLAAPQLRELFLHEQAREYHVTRLIRDRTPPWNRTKNPPIKSQLLWPPDALFREQRGVLVARCQRLPAPFRLELPGILADELARDGFIPAEPAIVVAAEDHHHRAVLELERRAVDIGVLRDVLRVLVGVAAVDVEVPAHAADVPVERHLRSGEVDRAVVLAPSPVREVSPRVPFERIPVGLLDELVAIAALRVHPQHVVRRVRVSRRAQNGVAVIREPRWVLDGESSLLAFDALRELRVAIVRGLFLVRELERCRDADHQVLAAVADVQPVSEPHADA